MIGRDKLQEIPAFAGMTSLNDALWTAPRAKRAEGATRPPHRPSHRRCATQNRRAFGVTANGLRRDVRGLFRPAPGLRRRGADYRTPVLEPVAQDRDQRQVGGRHRVIAQAGRACPVEALTLSRGGNPAPLAAGEQRHEQVEVVIGVAGEGERGEAALPRADAQFLVEFADQAGLRGFARLDLSAGKLPQAGHRLVRRPLRQQNAAVRVDQRHRRDQDHAPRGLRSDSRH